MKNFSRWDRKYKKGAHWEKGPSKEIIEFKKYLQKGCKVLDAGCGSGRNSIFLTKKGFEVWGIDISNIGIKKAKEKFQSKNLHFLVGNIEKTSFKSNFFDAVYSGGVLNFIPLKKPSLEIFRILKKGGVALLWLIIDTKIKSTGERKLFHDKDEITSIYRKKFLILKQKEFISKDLKAKKPHIHKIFELILKK